MEPIGSRSLATALCALLAASCTSQTHDGTAACKMNARQNLDLCMAGATSSAAFVQKLCREEFEEQIEACIQ